MPLIYWANSFKWWHAKYKKTFKMISHTAHKSRVAQRYAGGKWVVPKGKMVSSENVACHSTTYSIVCWTTSRYTTEKSGWMLFDALTLLSSAATYFRKESFRLCVVQWKMCHCVWLLLYWACLFHFSHFGIHLIACMYIIGGNRT